MKIKYEASIREIENGFLTKDNYDGEYFWNNAKDAFAHIQECLEKTIEFNNEMEAKGEKVGRD